MIGVKIGCRPLVFTNSQIGFWTRKPFGGRTGGWPQVDNVLFFSGFQPKRALSAVGKPQFQATSVSSGVQGEFRRHRLAFVRNRLVQGPLHLFSAGPPTQFLASLGGFLGREPHKSGPAVFPFWIADHPGRVRPRMVQGLSLQEGNRFPCIGKVFGVPLAIGNGPLCRFEQGGSLARSRRWTEAIQGLEPFFGRTGGRPQRKGFGFDFDPLVCGRLLQDRLNFLPRSVKPGLRLVVRHFHARRGVQIPHPLGGRLGSPKTHLGKQEHGQKNGNQADQQQQALIGLGFSRLCLPHLAQKPKVGENGLLGT